MMANSSVMICPQNTNLFRNGAVPAVTKFHASSAPFHEVWNGALQEVSKNKRLSTKVVANAEFTRRSRKKPVEPKRKDAISKDIPVSRKPGSGLATDDNDQSKAKTERDISGLDTDEVNQKSRGDQHVAISGGEKNSQVAAASRITKDIKRDVVDSRTVGSGAGVFEREKSQKVQDNEKTRDAEDLSAAMKKKETEELLKEHNLKKEKAEARRRDLENLAKENSSLHSKMFFYPIVANAGQEIEIFLNRSITTLANEPMVLIMGAFNNWKWNSFITELQKSELNGDWWTCKLFIPKETYKIDFVFFNGGKVYENNDRKDFSIAVEGGMDKQSFEDFLLEEKRRELERLGAEQAEREREAAEWHRVEEENAAKEADRAEAKKQVAERREQTRRVLQMAVQSVDSLWYIEPAEFRGGDRVETLLQSFIPSACFFLRSLDSWRL